MSDSIFEQMNNFHDFFGIHRVIKEMDKETLLRFLDFRLGMMQEEIFEIEDAIENKDPEEIVDGIIDLIVFAAGTLDLYNVDGDQAWDEVYKANITKEVGIKEGRENPYNLPDLVKPEGWEGPDHEDNVGRLRDVFDE